MEDLSGLLNSVGALAELVCLFKAQLIANGCNSAEALILTQAFMHSIILGSRESQNEED